MEASDKNEVEVDGIKYYLAYFNATPEEDNVLIYLIQEAQVKIPKIDDEPKTRFLCYLSIWCKLSDDRSKIVLPKLKLNNKLEPVFNALIQKWGAKFEY